MGNNLGVFKCRRKDEKVIIEPIKKAPVKRRIRKTNDAACVVKAKESLEDMQIFI